VALVLFQGSHVVVAILHNSCLGIRVTFVLAQLCNCHDATIRDTCETTLLQVDVAAESSRTCTAPIHVDMHLRHAIPFSSGVFQHSRQQNLCRVLKRRNQTSFRTVCASQSAQAPAAAAVPTTHPTWSSHVSRRINLELAIEEAIEGARKGQAEDWEPELAIVFLSSAYVQEYASLISLLRSKVPSLKHIIGSSVRFMRQLTQQHARHVSNWLRALLPQASRLQY